MDLARGDMLIFSGEGDNGTWERYEGKRTPAAIRNRLSRERAGGDRWADAWIELAGVQDSTRNGNDRARVYGKLGRDLNSIGGERSIDEASIRVNPAAQLAAGHKRAASAANGAKGGAPRWAQKHTDEVIGLPEGQLDTYDWRGCYPVIADGRCTDVWMQGDPLPSGWHFDEARQALVQ